ncbi:MAG: hypothetical protein RLZZ453_160 [Chlamydiota bacterium]|jgi:hypothetical protein
MSKMLLILCGLCGFSQLRSDEGWNKTELRGAAFVPTSHTFKKIYGDVLPSLQIEQSRGFKHVPNLEVWGNFEWIFGSGNGMHSCGKTSIDILNISFGLKGIGAVYRDWIYLYGGLGPDLGITFITNKAACCPDCNERQSTHNSNVGVGGIAKSGCQIFVTPHFYFDFFADYLYLPMSFHNTKDIGGLKAGLGLSGRY